MSTYQHQLPPKGNFEALTLADMMQITARLNDILVTESDLLSAMKVKELAPLQAEKQKLSKSLESFQKRLATDDSLLATADTDTRRQLLTMTDTLAVNVEETMRRTQIAQNVNRRVLCSIMEVMADQQRTGAYGATGVANSGPEVRVSVNINERA